MRREKEAGFTIQELMVVMVVGSLLIAMTLSLFLFSRKLFLTWQDESIMRSTAAHVLQTLARDIAESGGMLTISDSTLVISQRPGRKRIEYRFARGRILRGDMLLNNEDRPQIVLKITPRNGKDAFYGSYATILVTALQRTKSYNAQLQVPIPRSSRGDFLRARIGHTKSL